MKSFQSSFPGATLCISSVFFFFFFFFFFSFHWKRGSEHTNRPSRAFDYPCPKKGTNEGITSKWANGVSDFVIWNSKRKLRHSEKGSNGQPAKKTKCIQYTELFILSSNWDIIVWGINDIEIHEKEVQPFLRNCSVTTCISSLQNYWQTAFSIVTQ